MLLTFDFEYFCAKYIFIANSAAILSSPIEYLKGVGPQRAELLKKEAAIFTFGDLLNYFPYRHIDRTKITPIGEAVIATDFIQVSGRLLSAEIVGAKGTRRLVAQIADRSGVIDLVVDLFG